MGLRSGKSVIIYRNQIKNKNDTIQKTKHKLRINHILLDFDLILDFDYV